MGVDIAPEFISHDCCLSAPEAGGDEYRVCINPPVNKRFCPRNRKLEIRAAHVEPEAGKITHDIFQCNVGEEYLAIDRPCRLVNLLLDPAVLRAAGDLCDPYRGRLIAATNLVPSSSFFG